MRVLILLLAMGVPAMAGEIAWKKDFGAARRKAMVEGKLVFLDFFSPH